MTKLTEAEKANTEMLDEFSKINPPWVTNKTLDAFKTQQLMDKYLPIYANLKLIGDFELHYVKKQPTVWDRWMTLLFVLGQAHKASSK
jgi:hypothetical protein